MRAIRWLLIPLALVALLVAWYDYGVPANRGGARGLRAFGISVVDPDVYWVDRSNMLDGGGMFRFQTHDAEIASLVARLELREGPCAMDRGTILLPRPVWWVDTCAPGARVFTGDELPGRRVAWLLYDPSRGRAWLSIFEF